MTTFRGGNNELSFLYIYYFFFYIFNEILNLEISFKTYQGVPLNVYLHEFGEAEVNVVEM